MTHDEQIVELIHQNSLRLLSETGMAFQSGEALETLRRGGIRTDGNRAYFTEKQVMDAIAPEPMAGGTGPITLAGNISVANAEILGTNVYAQMIRPGTPVIYGFAATVSNMRNMNVSNAGGLTALAGVESAMSLFESFSD